MLTQGQADSMISGLDYSSRDVLLAYKATSEITDDTERAEALLYLIESIDKI